MNETLQCEFDGRFENWRSSAKEHLQHFYCLKDHHCQFCFVRLLCGLQKLVLCFSKGKLHRKTNFFFFLASFSKFSGRWSLVNQDEFESGNFSPRSHDCHASSNGKHQNSLMCTRQTPIIPAQKLASHKFNLG